MSSDKSRFTMIFYKVRLVSADDRETETEPTRDAGVKKQWKLCCWSILMVGGLGTTSRSLHQVQDSLTVGG